jgi:hypothetical protein
MANKLFRPKVSLFILNLLLKGREDYIFMEGFILIWASRGMESLYRWFTG